MDDRAELDRWSDMDAHRTRRMVPWCFLIVIVAATVGTGMLTGWQVGVLWASSACSLTLAAINLLLGARERPAGRR